MSLTNSRARADTAPVAAVPATGFGDPTTTKAHKRPHSIAGAFFVPAVRLYGGCARETFGSAGFLCARFANLRTAVTPNRLATIGDGSQHKEASPMSNTAQGAPAPVLSPSQCRAAAHRAMALAALRADSSLSNRLARYNGHMTKARHLEAEGGVMAKPSHTVPKLVACDDTPEGIFNVLAKATGATFDDLADAIGTALTRANALCVVLIDQLGTGEAGGRLSDAVLCDLAWSVQGMCAEVGTLVDMAMRGGGRSDD